ncbi:hypothetical protein [Paenibacillus aquistagni]|uniref:hypothetical protein n=1 Tax=Paenibacillus aquistagni TaxID=1852522 RepID=UPI00145B9E1F|nr:hypothetical protein [Paenibacillus aquistagni]NMM53370.1 hypothetical protein [Paenibacillus aquistagni]
MTMPLPRLSEEQIKLLNQQIAESNLDAGQWLNHMISKIFREEGNASVPSLADSEAVQGAIDA